MPKCYILKKIYIHVCERAPHTCITLLLLSFFFCCCFVSLFFGGFFCCFVLFCFFVFLFFWLYSKSYIRVPTCQISTWLSSIQLLSISKSVSANILCMYQRFLRYPYYRSVALVINLQAAYKSPVRLSRAIENSLGQSEFKSALPEWAVKI